MKEKKSICLTFELVSNDKTAFGSFAFTILIELIKRRFIKKDHSKKQINRNFTLFCSLAAFNIINLSESIKHLINFDCVLDDRVRIFLLLLHKFEIRVNQSNTSQRYTIRAEIEIDLFYLAIFFSNSHSLRLFSVVAHVSISLSLSLHLLNPLHIECCRLLPRTIIYCGNYHVCYYIMPKLPLICTNLNCLLHKL